jgi:hypothetical protein
MGNTRLPKPIPSTTERVIPCEYTASGFICDAKAEVFWITPNRKRPWCYCLKHSRYISLPAMARSISYDDVILEDVMDS